MSIEKRGGDTAYSRDVDERQLIFAEHNKRRRRTLYMWVNRSLSDQSRKP